MDAGAYHQVGQTSVVLLQLMQFSWACKTLLKGSGHAKQEIKHIEQEYPAHGRQKWLKRNFRTFLTLP
jgi:hypothetical protein